MLIVDKYGQNTAPNLTFSICFAPLVSRH